MTLVKDRPLLERRWRALLLVLVCIAGAEFLARGPVRFAHSAGFNDFISPYLQSRAWIKGMDPYSPASLAALWPEGVGQTAFLEQGVAHGSLAARHGIPSPYPVSCFLLLSPLAMLSWPTAHVIWNVITTSAFGLAVWALASVAGFRLEESRTYLFVALALAQAPSHTAIATGNLAIAALAMNAGSIWAAERGSGALAGVLLAGALSLKPTIGLGVLLYFVALRRWRISSLAVGAALAVALIAGLRLGPGHLSWLHSYVENSSELFAPGAINDPSPANPSRFNLINVQVLLYGLVHNLPYVNGVACLLAGMMLACWLFLVGRQPSPHTDLLALSSVTVLTLLPVYHRFYDAVVLLFPLCWSIKALGTTKNHFARTTLLLIVPFLIPGASLLQHAVDAGRIPAGVAHSLWWDMFIMPHQAWVLVLLSMFLLCSLVHRQERSASSPAP